MKHGVSIQTSFIDIDYTSLSHNRYSDVITMIYVTDDIIKQGMHMLVIIDVFIKNKYITIKIVDTDYNFIVNDCLLEFKEECFTEDIVTFYVNHILNNINKGIPESLTDVGNNPPIIKHYQIDKEFKQITLCH